MLGWKKKKNSLFEKHGKISIMANKGSLVKKNLFGTVSKVKPSNKNQLS